MKSFSLVSAGRKLRSPQALLLVLCVGAAWLTNTGHAATYTLGAGTASTGDTVGNSSFTNPLTGAAAGWYLSGTGAAVAPTAGNAYVVASTSTTANDLLRGPSSASSYTFPGDSLSINPGGRFIIKALGTTQTLTVNNLILNGGYADQATGNQGAVMSTLAGNVAVTAASGLGALAGETLTLGANLSGTGALTLAGPTINANGDTGAVIFTGNNANYSGLLTLAGGTLEVRVDGGLGSGNVTLNTGTLTLDAGATNNYLGDKATFSLLSGAKAALNFTGSDTVGSLVLGGTALNPGTYNATNEAAYFTGTGSITVVPEPSSVASLLCGGLAALGAIIRARRK